MGEGESAGRGIPEEERPLDPEFAEAEAAKQAGFSFTEEEVLADVQKRAESLRHNDERMEKLLGKPELLQTAGHIIGEAFAKSSLEQPVQPSPESHISPEREWRAKHAVLLTEWAGQMGVAKAELPNIGLNEQQLEDKFWQQMEIIEDLYTECQASQGQGNWTDSDRQAIEKLWNTIQKIQSEVKEQKNHFKAAFITGDAGQLKKDLRTGFIYFKDQLPELKKYSHELKQLLLRHHHEG